VLGVFAEFETDLRRDRMREGIARAKRDREISKATGRYKYSGGVKTLDRSGILADLAAGLGVSAVARKHGIARQSVYNIKSELLSGAKTPTEAR
jgi:DNA invertase Pin-like site-specific DNA recombinase